VDELARPAALVNKVGGVGGVEGGEGAGEAIVWGQRNSSTAT
jgi:hypothetical protein